ncbi:MAG: SufD family Fe-S cluster assembly protein, partial [Bacteroidetes bacterium]|nr:SufD family Fe-S cluster assembly protein [Bacteroidota bacterium]
MALDIKSAIENLKDLRSQQLSTQNNGVGQEAVTLLDELQFPNKKHEEWKYTSFEKVFGAGLTLPNNEILASNSTLELDAYSIELINGKLVRADSISGVSIRERKSVANYDKSQYFNVLNAAFAPSVIEITIAKSVEVDKPILLQNTVAGNQVLGHARIEIIAEENSRCCIVESNVFENGASGYQNRLANIKVERNAFLDHIMIQNYGQKQSALHTTNSSVKTGGNYTNQVATFGGEIIRNELNIALTEPHCECHLNGLYLIGEKSHVDNHTAVDHQQPNCESNEFYKGVMKDSATGVFNGKVFVREDAQQTNAYQQNRNLLLSENATINTKPQLEIWADDVKCSH